MHTVADVNPPERCTVIYPTRHTQKTQLDALKRPPRVWSQIITGSNRIRIQHITDGLAVVVSYEAFYEAEEQVASFRCYCE